jgi:hypothetical protein
MVRGCLRDLPARRDAFGIPMMTARANRPAPVGGPMRRSNGILSAGLLDANEPFWAFGAPGCVGSATNLQLRPLALMGCEELPLALLRTGCGPGRKLRAEMTKPATSRETTTEPTATAHPPGNSPGDQRPRAHPRRRIPAGAPPITPSMCCNARCQPPPPHCCDVVFVS